MYLIVVYILELKVRVMEQESKTEKATEKKRSEERKRGNVAKTTELGSALIILVSFIIINFITNRLISILTVFMAKTFNFNSDLTFNFEYLKNIYYEGFAIFLKTAGIFLLCSAALGLIAEIFQVKLVFTFGHLRNFFDRINPINGFKKYFSLDYVVGFLKNIIKAVLISFIVYALIKARIFEIMLLMGREPSFISDKVVSLVYQIGLRAALAMLAIAVFDYFFQKNRYEKRIMMTRQEIKMELKQQEGDPLLKVRRKSKHLQLARARMMKELPTADVVVTNPTTYAVALKYRPDFNAPKVIAKGMRLIAEKIKKVAIENDIPIIENVFIAQTIYKTCEIGQEITPELYKAVAEILAYVYKIKGNYRELGLI